MYALKILRIYHVRKFQCIIIGLQQTFFNTFGHRPYSFYILIIEALFSISTLFLNCNQSTMALTQKKKEGNDRKNSKKDSRLVSYHTGSLFRFYSWHKNTKIPFMQKSQFTVVSQNYLNLPCCYCNLFSWKLDDNRYQVEFFMILGEIIEVSKGEKSS